MSVCVCVHECIVCECATVCECICVCVCVCVLDFLECAYLIDYVLLCVSCTSLSVCLVCLSCLSVLSVTQCQHFDNRYNVLSSTMVLSPGSGTVRLRARLTVQLVLSPAHQLSQVTSLPGWSAKSYSGYITVNATHQSNMFFWFFPAQVGPGGVTGWLGG